MTERELIIFIEVCKTRKISQAARNLYIAQPSISFTIKKLEKQYNTTFFERLSNKLELTDDGIKLYEYARSILHTYQTIENIMKNTNLFNLTIGMPQSIPSTLINHLSIFYRYHTYDVMDIVLYSEKVLLKKLISGEIDGLVSLTQLSYIPKTVTHIQIDQLHLYYLSPGSTYINLLIKKLLKYSLEAPYDIS